MYKGEVLLVYENMDEDYFDFAHLKAFCNLFGMNIRQPDPLCKEKKRHCDVDEYNLYNRGDYWYDHYVYVDFSGKELNQIYDSIGILERYAHLTGMRYTVSRISEEQYNE